MSALKNACSPICMNFRFWFPYSSFRVLEKLSVLIFDCYCLGFDQSDFELEFSRRGFLKTLARLSEQDWVCLLQIILKKWNDQSRSWFYWWWSRPIDEIKKYSIVSQYHFGPIPGIDVGMSWDWQFRVT